MEKLFSKNNLLLAVALVIGFILIRIAVDFDRLARIGAGYKAKVGCSEVFVAGRDPEDIIRGEFNDIDDAMDAVSVSFDKQRKSAGASAFGFGRARAVYREGYGCTLANGGRIDALPPRPPSIAGDPFQFAPPVTGSAIDRVDYAAVDYALMQAFEENTARHRAAVILVDGKIIDERYTEGFGANTPFLSWSMGKSVVATLVGAAQLHGYLNIDEPAPVPEWNEGDPRRNITWRDLLQMQSGLDFEERYTNPRSDVNRTLFELADAGGFAAAQSATVLPGATWSYASGTSNLIARTLRQVLAENGADLYEFATAEIFEPIGAASVIMEPDSSGSPIGSSFMYATARDWARLGQLYLQRGVWDGERILPVGWAAFVSTPASESDNQYGGHFWLNRDGVYNRERFFPGMDEDVYFFAGHEGQYVFIIPSKRAIIVRTGMTRRADAMETVRPMIEAIYMAIGD